MFIDGADEVFAYRNAGLEAFFTPGRKKGMVGRDQELSRVKHLLEKNRAVWLHGPPGEGKSLLAAEVGRVMKSRKQAAGGIHSVQLKGGPPLTDAN